MISSTWLCMVLAFCWSSGLTREVGTRSSYLHRLAPCPPRCRGLGFSSDPSSLFIGRALNSPATEEIKGKERPAPWLRNNHGGTLRSSEVGHLDTTEDILLAKEPSQAPAKSCSELLRSTLLDSFSLSPSQFATRNQDPDMAASTKGKPLASWAPPASLALTSLAIPFPFSLTSRDGPSSLLTLCALLPTPFLQTLPFSIPVSNPIFSVSGIFSVLPSGTVRYSFLLCHWLLAPDTGPFSCCHLGFTLIV